MASRKNPDRASITEEFRDKLVVERGDWHGRRMLLIGNYYSAPLFAELEKDFGLLRDEVGILGNLYDYGPLTAKIVCQLTGRPKNSVSRGVTSLLESGRISARVNPEDRRESFLKIEAAGRRIYEEILPLWRQQETALMRCLSAAERASLDHILAKLLEQYHRERF